MSNVTIIISTLNEGILHLEKTIKLIHPNIRYLIVHQNVEKIGLPSFLQRKDIEVIETPTKGLSVSRNIGLRNCKTDYGIIADDDVEYIEDGITQLLEIIKTDKPDFATFKIKTPDDEPDFKDYPLAKHDFSKSILQVASIEILLNVKKIRNKHIAFDERFGLGTKLRQAEEEIFIHDLIDYDFYGTYYPLFFVKHPYESTGSKIIKESHKYFLKGAFAQRTRQKHKIHRYESLIRFLKNIFWFHIGRFYILSTKKTIL